MGWATSPRHTRRLRHHYQSMCHLSYRTVSAMVGGEDTGGSPPASAARPPPPPPGRSFGSQPGRGLGSLPSRQLYAAIVYTPLVCYWRRTLTPPFRHGVCRHGFIINNVIWSLPLLSRRHCRHYAITTHTLFNIIGLPTPRFCIYACCHD